MAVLDQLRNTIKGPQGLAIVAAGAALGYVAFRRRPTAAPAETVTVPSGYVGEEGADYSVPGGGGGGGGTGGAGDTSKPVVTPPGVAPGVTPVIGSPVVTPFPATAPSPTPTRSSIVTAPSNLPSDFQVGSPASWDLTNPYRPPVIDPLGGYTDLAPQGGYFRNQSYLGYGPNAIAQGLYMPTDVAPVGGIAGTTDRLSARILESATPAQLSSPEWRQTWNAIQAESGFTARLAALPGDVIYPTSAESDIAARSGGYGFVTPGT